MAPNPDAPPDWLNQGPHYVLRVDITLKEGLQAWTEFNRCSISLLEIMKEKLPTWRLIGSYSSVTGVPNRVLNVWRIRDANALLEGMNWFAHQKLYSELSACCVEQRQDLYTPTRFNPSFVNT